MAKNKKKKNSSMGLLVALLAVVLIALLAVALIVLPKMTADTPPAQEPTKVNQTDVPGETAVPVQTQAISGTEQPIQQTEPSEESNDADPISTTEALQQESPAATEGASTVVGNPSTISLDDGKLEITSIFPYTGLNPDCNLEEGTDIASIMLKNTSGTYLAKADIDLTLTDGTSLRFTATDLPAGENVMAFDLDNKTLSGNPACSNAGCEASYDGTASMEADRVSVSVDGMTVTVTNLTGQTLSQIDVYCRSPLGEEFFGGTAYMYTIHDLPAGESTEILAFDCILGMAEVVRVVIK